MRARPAALVFVLALAPLSCANKGSDYPYLPAGGAGGNGGNGGAVTPNGAVSVSVLSPADGQILSDATTLAVTATVDDTGTDVVDTNSVKMTVTAPGGGAPVASGQLVSTGGDNYGGTLSLGDLPSGSYALTVSAQSLTGVTGQSAAVTLNVQGGPTLIVSSPVEGQAYSTSVPIQILIDSGATPPTAVLAGMPVTLSAPTPDGTHDVYTATVSFGPTSPSNPVNPFPALAGPQLLDIKESDGVATSEVQRTFVIDTSGPTITQTTPAASDVVGGVVKISATVGDPAGVLDSSVIAVIGDQQNDPLFTLQLQPQGNDVYSTLFDTQNLTQCQPPPATSLCIVFPTVSFRATDSVGNETSVGYAFSVDNVPPVADLDPPLMRQMRYSTFGFQCSTLFDPLSLNQDVGDMPNDGCTVPQVFDLRARIEDDGNRAAGLKVVPIAGIDPDNTSIYILTDGSQPLVVDTNGDGTCDAINPLLAPTVGPMTQSDQVLKVRLGGVPYGGSANFAAMPVDPSLPIAGACAQGTDSSGPKVLCSFQQPTIAISYADGQPAIWSVEPIDSSFHCLGNQFDTRANNVADGQWICMAVGTTDLAGNHSVSKPMRVYVQYSDAGGFCATPPASAGPPPPCTGSYDPVAKTAALGACTTLTFPSGELYCAPGGC